VRFTRRTASPFILAGAIALVSSEARAYCPCYTASSSNNTHNCGVEAVSGTNPTIAEWQQIFDLVAKGPTVWANQGPAVADIGQGCGKPEPLHDVPALFPCEVLEAIAMAESGWTQFCVPDTPADQVGGASRTIISFDCGYGVGQVTSGMHAGENPAFDQQRVAAEPAYNMATGASILASKWRATNCVGDNQPSVVEDWYTAVWAYNGLAYSNNPSNPSYSSTRGVWDPQVGGAAPYQEKVFGRIEHPSGSPSYWPAVALAYPNPADVGGSGSPPDLPESSCASPTDCVGTRSVHESNCFSGSGGSGGSGGSAGGAGASSGGTSGGGGAGGAAAGGASGATGGSGASPSGGSTASDAGLAATPDAGDLDGSCGCRAAGERTGASVFWLLGAVAVALGLRRR
jgi:MYXO-CTERM domain-containing protein